MARLDVSLLGAFQANLDEDQIIGFDSDKVRALLAYLLVEADRPHRRERLAGLLWPEYPDKSARTSLRSALANLRQVISDHEADPPFLIITRQFIRFNHESDHKIDVNAFAKLVRVETGSQPEINQLEKAVDLYRGDFMEGFSLPDSSAFEDWILITRESLRSQAMHALHSLTEYFQKRGAYEQALRYARTQVEMEPYQEAAHQQMMWILAQSGERNKALKHYDDFRQLLDVELGATPLQQTQEMYSLLQEGELPCPPSPTVILRREPREVGECPYRGLSVFREKDAPYFYGRESFIERLLETINRRTMIALIVGASGSGKSSTVYAGLLPKINQEKDWLLVDFRPGNHPFQAIANALLPILEPELSETDRLVEVQKLSAAMREGELPLYEVLERSLEKNSARKRLLFVVDQFEELFTLCPEPELRRRFLDELIATKDARAEHRVSAFVLLLTLRADFMGQALTHRPFADELQEGSLILGPMNRGEMRMAIEKPAEIQGAAFETGLVARLLDDVGEEPGNLPLLEFALGLLWERLDQGWMTHAAYEAIGRVDGALAGYAENVYKEMNSSEQEDARRVFVQLVQPGQGTEDTRRRATRVEIGDESWGLVQHLADKRMVVTGMDEGGQETVEVVHEALIKEWGRMRDWMDQDRAFRTWQENLRAAMRQWEDSERDEDALLRGAPLIQAEAWMKDQGGNLIQQEKDFIQSSLELQERKIAIERRSRNILRALAGVLAIATVIALTLSAYAFDQRTIAQREARISASRELAAAAINNLEVDPERSILLALQSVDETYSVDRIVLRESEEALHLALGASRVRMTLIDEEEKFFETVDFSPDGTKIATWSKADWEFSPFRPGHTKVWDALSGQLLVSLPGINAAAFSPAGKQLSTIIPGGQGADYVFWDLPSGQKHSSINISTPLPSVAGAYDPDWNRVALALLNGQIMIFDLETGEELLKLGGEGRSMDFNVIFSPDGDHLATGNEEGTIEIWDLKTGEILNTFSGHTAIIYDLVYTMNGKYLISASADGTAIVWDAITGEKVVTFTGHTNELLGLALSNDGQFLATTSWDRRVKFWDLPTSITARSGQELFTLAGHTEAVEDAAFSSDKTRLASVSRDGQIKIWDISPTGGSEGLVFQHAKQVSGDWSVSLALSPDESRLVTAMFDPVLKMWDSSTGTLVKSLTGHKNNVPTATFSPEGAYLLTRSFNPIDYHNQIKGWEVTSGEEIFSLDDSGHTLSEIAISPDGKLLAVGNVSGDVSLIDFARLLVTRVDSPDLVKLILPTKMPEGYLIGIDFSPDGKYVVTSGAGNTAIVWDVESGGKLITLSGHEASIHGVAYSNDGKQIASASMDGTARVWDSETGKLLLSLSEHNSSVLSVAFNPDGSRLASASNDGTARLWDVISGQELLTFYGHHGGVTDVAFSPDGSRLYTASLDGSVRVHLLDIEELIASARDRLTRGFTTMECQKYLHLESCPSDN